MANTNANRIANAAKQACLELGLEPTFKSSRRVIESGKTSIRSMKNYYNRKEITSIEQKPYTNEFGQQEAFGSICARNLEYAEGFVQKNMAKFEGGVNNMTEASFYIMRIQREQINKLSSN
jgi:hypothetical protein